VTTVTLGSRLFFILLQINLLTFCLHFSSQGLCSQHSPGGRAHTCELRGKMAGTLSLPPQVNGRIHGSLRLAVERINWRVVRPPDSSQVIHSDAPVSRLLRLWHVAPTRCCANSIDPRRGRGFRTLENMIKICFIVLTHALSCVCEAGASKVVGRGRLWLVASSCCVRGARTCSYELCILLHSVQQVSRLLSLSRARALVIGAL
jgi:hypothetical protein